MKDFMMTSHPGEFWVANIPFTNGAASKKRPVLILWLDGDDVVAAVVTSDIAFNDWSISGLRVASTVRLSRLNCLEQSLLLIKIGQISEIDADQVKTAWNLHIKPQF
jgi:mRNA interferase MazF